MWKVRNPPITYVSDTHAGSYHANETTLSSQFKTNIYKITLDRSLNFFPFYVRDTSSNARETWCTSWCELFWRCRIVPGGLTCQKGLHRRVRQSSAFQYWRIPYSKPGRWSWITSAMQSIQQNSLTKTNSSRISLSPSRFVKSWQMNLSSKEWDSPTYAVPQLKSLLSRFSRFIKKYINNCIHLNSVP